MSAPEFRVVFVAEDEGLEATFDGTCHDIPALYRQLEAGELEHKCALVQKLCPACDSWETVDSLGSILAAPGDAYWGEIERELIEEATRSALAGES